MNLIKNNKLIIFLFIFAVATGLFWNQKLFGQPIASDQLMYDGIAQDVLTKGTYTYLGEETEIEPGYPYFLVGIYKVFGHNYDTVRIIQILLFALLVCIIFILTRELFGIRVALGASVLTASFYALANQAGLIQRETLFTFLLVLLIFCLHKTKNTRFKWWILAGIILGLATLVKGSMQLFLVPVIGYMLYIYWGQISFRKICFKVLALVIGFSVIVGPWLIKERMLGGEFGVAPKGGGLVLSTTGVAERLSQNYTGNFIGFFLGYYFAQKLYPEINPIAFRDTSKMDDGIAKLTKEGKNLREIDAIFYQEAKEYIIQNPQKYMYMAVLNFISLNSPILTKGPLWLNVTAIHPMFADGRHPESSDLAKTVFALGIRAIWFAMFFFVGYGIWYQRKKLHLLAWILLLVLYLNVFYSLVWAIPRFALPMYPFYFILAIVGFYQFWVNNKWRISASL